MPTYTAKNYLGAAAATTLSAGITSGTMTLSVADGSTYPTANFNIVIDRGLVGEEKIFISSRTSNTLTVSARGADSTAASAHALGATVEHCGFALDFQQANDHGQASAGVHGVTGSVVGTSDTQTLTNKTLTSPVLNTPALHAGSIYFGSADQTYIHGALDGTILLGAVSGGEVIITPTNGLRIGTNDSAHDLGTAWQTYTPTFGNTSGATAVAAYKIVGKTLYFRIFMTAGSNTANTWQFSIPGTTPTDGGSQACTWGVNGAPSATINTAKGVIIGQTSPNFQVQCSNTGTLAGYVFSGAVEIA